MANYRRWTMRDFMTITKALADENRVRILMALKDRELCVCQIVEFLGLAPSTVSKHLAILKQARLIDCRKAGRWIYYQLADNHAPVVAGETLRWIQAALEKDQQTKEDKKRLRVILKMNPEELCRHQGVESHVQKTK